VAVFENRQPATAAKFITKSSLFILVRGVIRQLQLLYDFFQCHALIRLLIVLP
jgi:hypothetical protein